MSKHYCLFFDTFVGTSFFVTVLLKRSLCSLSLPQPLVGRSHAFCCHPTIYRTVLPNDDPGTSYLAGFTAPYGPSIPTNLSELTPSLFQAVHVYPWNVEGKIQGKTPSSLVMESPSKHIPPGMVAHKYDPSAQGAEVGGSDFDTSQHGRLNESLFPNTTKSPSCPPCCPHITGGK